MMHTVYTIFIVLLKSVFFLLSFLNEKIKKGYEGRKQSLSDVRKVFSPTDAVIWMHTASLGEYEQGLPVLENLKQQYPHHKILITFFSPSGYENVVTKKHPADVLCYLPFDTLKDLLPFVNSFRPEIFFTVKYDFWYRLLNILNEKGCKNFAIATHFYPRQIFFKPYGKWFASQLESTISLFFHQNQTSLELAKSIGLHQGIVSGDTRFDRVKTFHDRDNTVPNIEVFKQDKKLIILGSAWEGEEKILEKITETEGIKIIVAPHDISRIHHLKRKFPHAQCYSSLSEREAPHSKILLIDSIGLLSKLYAYADIAIVGGGFHSKGLHNILEAATFGIPVLFGNQYRKNPEADDLISANGAKSFDTPKSLALYIHQLLQNENMRAEMGKNAYEFVNTQKNSTLSITEHIRKFI